MSSLNHCNFARQTGELFYEEKRAWSAEERKDGKKRRRRGKTENRVNSWSDLGARGEPSERDRVSVNDRTSFYKRPFCSASSARITARDDIIFQVGQRVLRLAGRGSGQAERPDQTRRDQTRRRRSLGNRGRNRRSNDTDRLRLWSPLLSRYSHRDRTIDAAKSEEKREEEARASFAAPFRATPRNDPQLARSPVTGTKSDAIVET